MTGPFKQVCCVFICNTSLCCFFFVVVQFYNSSKNFKPLLIDIWSVCAWNQLDCRTRITVRTSRLIFQTGLCKYQQAASYPLDFSKPSLALLTFIWICCQRITFVSYEKLSRPACSNVVTHGFIIRAPGMRIKGPICDPNVNKRWELSTSIQMTRL